MHFRARLQRCIWRRGAERYEEAVGRVFWDLIELEELEAVSRLFKIVAEVSKRVRGI